MLATRRTRPIRWKEHADNLDAMVYMILVDAGRQQRRRCATSSTAIARKLAVYAKAMFGLALHKRGAEGQARHDPEEHRAVRGCRTTRTRPPISSCPTSNYWWYWYGNEIEANAYYLKLLSRTDPKGQKALAAGQVSAQQPPARHLLEQHARHRHLHRGDGRLLKASGEDRPDMTVEVWLDGKKHKDVHDRQPRTCSPSTTSSCCIGDAVETGKHKLEIKRNGNGPVYFNAYLTNFTLEDFITKAGLEVSVNRKYYKLTRVDKKVKVAGSRGQALDQKVEKYERTELANLAQLKSGDLVEVELEIDSKNDYEYIAVRGPQGRRLRAAWRSAAATSATTWALTWKCATTRSASSSAGWPAASTASATGMRAEIPGKFSALPTRA